jgi:hypothetical protein
MARIANAIGAVLFAAFCLAAAVAAGADESDESERPGGPPYICCVYMIF